jgi:ribosome-binding factor A
MSHHTLSRKGAAEAGPGRKAAQLCRQVAVTLQEVLAECRDPRLQALAVQGVEPAPDASRLLVTLVLDGGAGPADLAEAHARLLRASGHLRSEVASAITRKRAPVLVYRIAAGGTEAPPAPG